MQKGGVFGDGKNILLCVEGQMFEWGEGNGETLIERSNVGGIV